MKHSILFALGLSTLLMTGFAAHADGDADKGAKVFRTKCKTCHQVGPDAKNFTGPVLNGVYGRTAGTTDFEYSDAMKAKGADGLVWSEETLEGYLASPAKYVSGNKMMFVGLRKPSEIDDVIAFLKAQK